MDTYQTNIRFPNRQESYDLEVETISDGFQKALAKHEYPHTNGALLEDLGQKAREITIRCYFLNAAYYQHFAFLDALDDADTVELTHQIYGLLRGRIEKVSVRHSDREETAELDLTFIEGRIEDAPQAEVSMPGAGEEAFLDGQDEQQAGLADDIAGDLGTDGASAAAVTLDPEQGILAQMAGVAASVRAYVAQVESAIATLEGTMSQITQAANTVLATVNYAANLPGRIIGAVAQTVERFADAYQALRNFPAQFQRSLKSGLDQLESSFRSFQSKAPAGSSRNIAETAAMTTVANHIRLASSHRLALEAAYGFANDQANRLAAKKNENQKSFDMLGNYFEPVPPDPIMTRTDIEATLASVMTSAQGVVDLMRGTQQVKRACSGLIDYARKIMLDSERITTVDIDGTLPLHLILLQHGLPYNAADRVLAINPQIKHPSFVSGTINIYAA